MQETRHAQNIIGAVKHKHASTNTVYHCLYGLYFLGLSKHQLAKIYGKSDSTIAAWAKKFEKNGFYSKKSVQIIYKKFGSSKREWLVALYDKNPILFLHEAKDLFFQEFQQTISESTISIILREAGMTWKTLERRAIQLQIKDIARYVNELSSIEWLPEQLVFLDEVSFDNKSMLRKHGYGLKGNSLIFRSEFNRKPRVSLLCFLGLNGVLESYYTEGTFTRIKFVEKCKDFALENGTVVQQYPGRNSIWILDGAKIHCDPNIVHYLRSLGLIVLFLPAYAPFYNPIEFVFGLVKRIIQSEYKENSGKDLKLYIAEALNRLSLKNMRNLYEKCGYINGKFDHTKGLAEDITKLGFGK